MTWPASARWIAVFRGGETPRPEVKPIMGGFRRLQKNGAMHNFCLTSGRRMPMLLLCGAANHWPRIPEARNRRRNRAVLPRVMGFDAAPDRCFPILGSSPNPHSKDMIS